MEPEPEQTQMAGQLMPGVGGPGSAKTLSADQTKMPWQLMPGAGGSGSAKVLSVPAVENERREVDEDAVFSCSHDVDTAIREANRCAPIVVKRLRETLGDSLHYCVYPSGTVAVTSPKDEDAGLGLDPSPEASNSFTVHRGYSGGGFDVCMFEGQPRSTFVCFPFDASAEEVTVGMRARALLLQDLIWCERDTSHLWGSDSESEADLEIGTEGRLVSKGGRGLMGVQMTVQGGEAVRERRKRWASAPELEALRGEVIGTREQVLACLAVQAAVRARQQHRAQMIRVP